MAVQTEEITRGSRIGDVVERYPDAARLFAKHRVETCCNHDSTIEAAGIRYRVEVSRLLRNLNALIDGG